VHRSQPWLDEGLGIVCITRDLTWGVVPSQASDKVFYVQFDAPISCIAAAIEWSAAGRDDRRAWWQGGDGVHCAIPRQDNVPFHHKLSATILGSRSCAQAPDIIKGFNWLTFAGGKFSTSGQRGIFTGTADAASCRQLALVARCQRAGECRYRLHDRRFVDGVNKDLADTFRQSRQPLPGLRCGALRFDGSRGWRCQTAGKLAAGRARLKRLRGHHERWPFARRPKRFARSGGLQTPISPMPPRTSSSTIPNGPAQS
jgi:methionyl-tRNA synthetase